MAKPEPVDLDGLRVLITRPAGRGTELCATLTSAGAEVMEQPLLEISALDADRHAQAIQHSRSRILDLDHYQRLIFVSVNAVAYGLALIEQFWPQWPMGLKVYAIGDATAQVLRQHDIPVHSSPSAAMNSESLLASDELQALHGEKILILRGLGGREHLAEQLQLRGARVDYAECYQRRCPDLGNGDLGALLVKHKPHVVCLNSGETLSNFHRFCPPAGNTPTLLLPGQRVAEQARALGYSRLLQAENAGTAATLAALRQMMREDNERR